MAFDFVVGNPPYVRDCSIPEDMKKYFSSTYEFAFKKYDLYVLFIGRGIMFLRAGGKLGFITSNKFTVSDYGLKLRQYILKNCAIKQLADVSQVQVFQEASPYPCLIILERETNEKELEKNKVESI